MEVSVFVPPREDVVRITLECAGMQKNLIDRQRANVPAFNATPVIKRRHVRSFPSMDVLNCQTGPRVRPTGYYAPELHAYGGQAAKNKLSRLTPGEQVNCRQLTRSALVVVCDVYCRGKNLADYFSEYQ